VHSGLPDGFDFQTKNANFGKYCRVLQWKMLVYFMTFGLFHGHFCTIFYDPLLYFVVIRYIFPVLVGSSKKNLATLDAFCANKLNKNPLGLRNLRVCRK
jgi:hypothetical protein